MATRKTSRKYKRNPEWPADRFNLNGVMFTDATVVEGDQWERYTTQRFPNKPPQLVYADQDEPATTDKQGKPEPREVKPPGGTTTKSLRPQEPVSTEDGSKTIVSTGISPEPERKPPEPRTTVVAPKPEPSKPEPPKEAKEEADDLTVLDGIGESRATAIAEAGFPTIHSLANADPKVLLQSVREAGVRMNLATARTIVRQAKQLKR